MGEKEKVSQWLLSNGVDFDESAIDNADLLESLTVCMDFIDELMPMQNELVDDYDSFSQNKYGDYNFYGKIANESLTKKEIVTAFATGLAKSWLASGLAFTTLNIISSVSKAFLSKLVILPNNQQRCAYLRIAILSGKALRSVTFNEVDSFLQEENYAIQCPFFDFLSARK